MSRTTAPYNGARVKADGKLVGMTSESYHADSQWKVYPFATRPGAHVAMPARGCAKLQNRRPGSCSAILEMLSAAGHCAPTLQPRSAACAWLRLLQAQFARPSSELHE